nr:unnamed protein product [Callosobruchus analis]
MKNQNDIICMPITMKLLRFHRAFPPKGALKKSYVTFYVKASLILMYCSIILIGSTLHFAKAMAGRLVITTVKKLI